jgi:hypothetical protein
MVSILGKFYGAVTKVTTLVQSLSSATLLI